MSQASQSSPSESQSPPPFNSTSLYVGDLDGNVTEAQLYETFSQIGPVVSIRVCRDLITRRSLGYAYINFNNSQDSYRALETLNFTPMNGRPMRIMFSQRDPAMRKSGSGNIFIKNLDKSIEHKELYDIFSAYGTILSCKVAADLNGVSKGYGFVQYESDDSAASAIEKANGMTVKDREIFVGPFQRRQERDPNAGSQKFNNLYVKNLEESFSEELLKELFEAHGAILSVAIMKDNDGKSKGFGFVNFELADDAMRAVEELNGKKIGEKEIYVGRALKKSEREEELRAKFEQERREKMERFHGVNLYLKNLDDTVDDDKIREIFAEFGAITSCKVMRDENGQSKGAGFVAFSAPEEATRAVTEMNGKLVNDKPIYVALAQRKDERKQRLQAHFQHRGAPAPAGPMFPQAGQQMYYGQHPPPNMFPQQGAGGPYGYPGVIPGAPGSGAVGPGSQSPSLLGVRPGAPGPYPQGGYYPPGQGQMLGRGSGPNRMGPGGNRQGGLGGPGGRHPGEGAPGPFSNQNYNQGAMGPRYSRGGPHRGGPGGFSNQNPSSQREYDSGRNSVAALAMALAATSPENRRMLLGEQLYPLVDALEHENAGKVTGMLLEMDQNEVLQLLERPELLKQKVQEAVDILRIASAADQMSVMNLSEG